MKKTTDKQAAKLVAIAVAAFPMAQERDMGPTAALWKQALGDLPYPVLEAALGTVIRTQAFWPSVAEIRQAAKALLWPEIALAARAWEAVAAEMRRVGWYGPPELSNPIAKRVVKMMGGWRQICASETPGIDRAQFLKLYTELAAGESGPDPKEPMLPKGESDHA